MKRKVITLIYLMIVFSSCSNRTEKIDNLCYFESQIILSDEGWSPIDLASLEKYITRRRIIYPAAKDAYGFSGAFLTIPLEGKHFSNLVKEITRKKIWETNLANPCNLFINSDRHYCKMDCPEQQYPLPDFKNNFLFLFEDEDFFVSKTSLYYVTKFEKGNFFIEKSIGILNNNRNPIINYNGLCSGSLVDFENLVVIIWIIVW